jgi:hypothetical protein
VPGPITNSQKDNICLFLYIFVFREKLAISKVFLIK